MRFCFISTKPASKTASSEVIEDSNGEGKGSNGASCGTFPAFTTIQPTKAVSCATTNEIVPTKPPDCVGDGLAAGAGPQGFVFDADHLLDILGDRCRSAAWCLIHAASAGLSSSEAGIEC